jgi:biopolymer transport protein ExbD
MSNPRRMRRLALASAPVVGLNLTSLMDVFTILVFFLLVNQTGVEVLEPPKEIKLPDSVAEAKARETPMIIVSETTVMVQGEVAAMTADVQEMKGDVVQAVLERLVQLRKGTLSLSADLAAKNNEIVILAHKTIPFKVLKKLMGTSTLAGYTKISLAVIQKASQN